MRISHRRFVFISWLPILLLGAAVAAAAPAEDGRLPAHKLSWEQLRATPDGPRIIERELERQRIHHDRWHEVHDLLEGRHVSAKSRRWLAERGLGEARFAAPLDAAAKANPDTLRILLVRISFAENRDPDLVTMAPDGDFFYEPRNLHPALNVDPEPHDKAFFESHLRGLSEFYQFQSGGRLHIDWKVLPEGDRDSYQLSDVADYGPGANNYWTLTGLESLVRDMMLATDAGTQADGSADLSDYDDDNPRGYIIFAHSGSDWQSDINQDTPNDIPTFFVTLGEPQAITGGQLSECSVIPETTSQDDYLGSIAAGLYHEFGHALGLPDVYDATTGLTSVGVWDLMDSGTNLAANLGYWDEDVGDYVGEPVTGILPPSLSAWCKWFLGWLETGYIEGGEGRQYKLPAVGVPRDRYSIHNQVEGNDFDTEDPQALIGGAAPGEFFLVENRWVPMTVEDTPYDPYDPETNWGGLYFKTDDNGSGVVLYLAGDRRNVPYINTGYYDYFLPQGGVLVWHADMDRIDAGMDDNAINQYGDGLKLVEADGIQDIGVLDAYVLGWYGSDRDVFAPWNEVGFDEVFPSGAGVPSSRANDRAWTGVHLWDIDDDGQAHGAVMRMQAAVEPLLEGWPVVLPAAGDADVPAPRALDTASVTPLAADGGVLLTACDDPPAGTAPVLFAWDTGGEPAYAATGLLPEGGVLELPDRLVGPPATVTLTGGDDALLVATADGTVQALTAGATGLDPRFTVSVGDSLLAGPQPVILAGDLVLTCVVDGDGRAVLLDEDGATVGDPVTVLGPGGGLVAPLRTVTDGDTAHVLFVHAAGWRWQAVDATGFLPTATVWPGALDGPGHVALLPDGDGHRLVLFGPEGLQGCWRLAPDGAWAMDEWPDPGEAVVCEPAVADLDGDGRLDVIAATSRRLFAWQDVGVSITGYPNDLVNLFPLPDTTAVAGPLVVADLDGGEGNEVAFVTDRGHLLILGDDGLPVPGTPFRGGDSGPTGLVVVPTTGDRISLAVAAAGGRTGDPLDLRLTNGRLSLYDERVLSGGAPATAAWFGAGGGPQRTGWVGTPQAIAGGAAAAAATQDVVFYPNPLTDVELTVRFWSATDRPAELAIYNLEGEPVLRRQLPAEADRLNEFTVDLDVASGLYLARLTSEKQAGSVVTEVKTVAVAR